MHTSREATPITGWVYWVREARAWAEQARKGPRDRYAQTFALTAGLNAPAPTTNPFKAASEGPLHLAWEEGKRLAAREAAREVTQPDPVADLFWPGGIRQEGTCV